MSRPWNHIDFYSDGITKFNKSLRPCLPVLTTNLHFNVVRLRKATRLGRLLEYFRPRGIKPHPSFALRGGANHWGKKKDTAGEWLQGVRHCLDNMSNSAFLRFSPYRPGPKLAGDALMDDFFTWLERRIYRWHIANVILVTLILAFIDSPALSGFVGALALAVLAIFGALGARRSMAQVDRPFHAFDILLLWLPGAFAFALATLGLWLSVKGDLTWIGLGLCMLHASLLVRIASDQFDGRTVLPVTVQAH